jgi:hypothetical protein
MVCISAELPTTSRILPLALHATRAMMTAKVRIASLCFPAVVGTSLSKVMHLIKIDLLFVVFEH